MTRILLGLLLLTACGKPIVEKKQNAEASPYMGGVSEELLLETDMSLNFDLLPLKGETYHKQKFWSGDSWRLEIGAINKRWNTPEKLLNYQSPGRREVLVMSMEDKKKLSPSEKYDLLMGSYHYPLKYEVDYLVKSALFSWEGLCHGWAGASMNHIEPAPKIMVNPDGVEIPFGTSDIKALLTYAYSKILIADGESIGKRCEEIGLLEEDFCNNDLSPVSFHAVLTNKLGLRGKSVIMDIDRYREVWNHPVVSFESTITRMKQTRSGKFVELKTKLTYVDVVEENSWTPLPRILSHMTVRYEITLDDKGNMTGGRWLTRERPDFIWVVKEAKSFEGYLGRVMELIR